MPSWILEEREDIKLLSINHSWPKLIMFEDFWGTNTVKKEHAILTWKDIKLDAVKSSCLILRYFITITLCYWRNQTIRYYGKAAHQYWLVSKYDIKIQLRSTSDRDYGGIIYYCRIWMIEMKYQFCIHLWNKLTRDGMKLAVPYINSLKKGDTPLSALSIKLSNSSFIPPPLHTSFYN